MSPTEDAATAPADAATKTRKPRLWPAIVLLALMWVIPFIPLDDRNMTVMMFVFLGPAVCALLILVWLLAFSRLPGRERLLGFGGVVLIAVVTMFLSHPTIQGFGTIGSAVPWGVTAFTAAFLLAQWLRWRPRTWIALAAAVVGFGYFTLVRSEGVWGDFHAEKVWRWAPAPEERILADLDERTPSGPGAVAAVEPLAEAEWPGFRGPRRDGVVPGVVLAEDWSREAPRELWRIPVGPGWSSFAVAGKRLFTQEQRGEEEVVVCYDADTGAELWAYAYPSRFWEALGGVGPRATPTLSEGRLFALGAEGFLHRLDPETGEVVWKADLRDDAGRQPPQWGFASSPLVLDGEVIVYAGGEGDRGILAYDADTGKLRWGAPAGNHSYSSPQLSTVEGTPCVPVVTNDGLTLVDPADGSVLLQYEWKFENYRILQPLMISESSFLISTGFGMGTRRVDLSVDDGRLTAKERWTSRAMKPDFNDFVAHEGNLYGFDVNILACVDLETGERRWKGGRYGHGQLVLLPDADQLLVISERGDLALVRAGTEGLDELAKLEEVLHGKTWNHPVVVGDRVYVRNGEEAVGLQVPLG